MNVSLTEELEQRVEDRVRSGMYGSASEVVREALRLFFRYDEARMREVDDLDRRIGTGLAELDQERLMAWCTDQGRGRNNHNHVGVRRCGRNSGVPAPACG